MKIGFLFWLLMILWLIFGFWVYWPAGGQWQPLGSNLLLWILLALLGWKVFGAPLQE